MYEYGICDYCKEKKELVIIISKCRYCGERHRYCADCDRYTKYLIKKLEKELQQQSGF